MRRSRLSWESDPLVNHLLCGSSGPVDGSVRVRHPAFKRIFSELREVHARSAGNIVAWFKSRLGRQSYCAVFSERKWVWESDVGWRAYVGREGLSFEVRTSLDDEGVERAWRDFLGRVAG